jgi:hypothetical protein
MGLAGIGIIVILFLVLVVFTLMISPPSAWVKGDRNRNKQADRDRTL